ncbi:MAG TPA: GNAT family N-acetyltransferase [Terriglobales bacterium]|nr:GNAT family N-acetyltransferase [Terriglobales bacterium]
MTQHASAALQIRTAVAADLPGLLALYRQLNPDETPATIETAEGLLEQFMRYRGSAILVGVKAGTIVASCALVVIPNLTRGGAPYALIENVITDAAHRRCGHGEAIVTAAVDRAWQNHCYKVMLLTGMTDAGTLQFYARCGFEQSKTGFQKRRIPARASSSSVG